MITPRYIISSLLGLSLITTVGVIGWETDWGRLLVGEAVTESTPRVATLDSKILPVYGLAPMTAHYKETVERPLFVPTRRPAPASTASQTAMKKGQFKLAGTTISAEVSVAYLFEAATNKTHRVNMGSEFNGMTVAKVEANKVVLRQGDDSEELSLRTSASPKPLPTHVAAPGQPGSPGQSNQPRPMDPMGGSMPGGTAMAGPGGQVPPPGMGGPDSGAPTPTTAPPGVGPTQGRPNVGPRPPDASNTGNVDVTAPPADANTPQTRRRRFQNLPQ